jgi:hypothetical protein
MQINMRAVLWQRASSGAGLCYRFIQIAPERSSTGSEQALWTLRNRFPRRRLVLNTDIKGSIPAELSHFCVLSQRRCSGGLSIGCIQYAHHSD